MIFLSKAKDASRLFAMAVTLVVSASLYLIAIEVLSWGDRGKLRHPTTVEHQADDSDATKAPAGSWLGFVHLFARHGGPSSG